MPSNVNPKQFLIIGGNGKTGARVVERLRVAGAAVRAASRSTSPAFDWDDADTWPPAIAGMDAAYITYAPDIALPGAMPKVRAFIELAVRSGLKRLVLLSGRGEEEAKKSEDALIASGADWTIVRASWFSQNFSEGFLLDEVKAGRVHFPHFDVPEPLIDVEDIADIVTAALLDDRHIGQLYEVTGPRLLTFRAALGEIAAASGRPIELVPMEVADYVAALEQAQVPALIVELLEILTTEVMDGRNTHTTDGVQRALGRPARDFSDYVRAAAATGVWEA